MTVAPLDSPTKIPLAAGSVYRCRHLPPTELLFRQSALRSPHPLHYIIVEKGPEQNREKNRSSCCQMTPVTILFSFPITFSVCFCVISVFASILICPLKIYTSTMIVSFPPNLFKRAILSTSKVRKTPGGGSTRGPCLHPDESQHPGTALYTKLRD